MKRSIRSRVLLAAALCAATGGAALPQVAQAGPAEPVVPSSISVPAGNKPFLVGHADGVQIYSCNATSGGFAWTFVAPRADLYGDNGKLITTHFGGPTWRARDGSQVVAARVESAPAPTPGAIPWLLLAATSTSAGEDGDRLTRTTYIQRINTTGGVAPAAADCNASTVGTVAEVPYTADYYFWKRTGG